MILVLEANMSAITIRRIDSDLKLKLSIRAGTNQRSMEEEVRCILRAALTEPLVEENLADIALNLFGSQFGVNLPTVARTAANPANFSE